MPRRRFGHVLGYPPGSWFESRKALLEAGVHRQLQAGISGSEREGAESIVLSGGYEDDQDIGEVIIYTGQGGRNPATGKQVSDQALKRGNLALAKSRTNGLPVRVIRKDDGGYRYSGLFQVVDFWREEGRAGYLVWRFRLVQIGSITAQEQQVAEEKGGYGAPKRAETTILRIVRDTEQARAVKELYDYRCQVCGTRLEGPAGPYAEAAHIRPLGIPHNGPDTSDNLLCLCPNHHVLFDLHAFSISDDLSLIGISGHLITHPGHRISRAHLAYHRRHLLAAPAERP